MERMRAGLMTVAALVCLGGQAYLLHAAAGGNDAALPWPWLFLLATCALAVMTALGDAPTGRRAWRVTVLAALAALLGLGLANLRQAGDEEEVLPGRAARRLDDATASLTALGPALDRFRAAISSDPADPFPAVTAADSAFVRGGSHFRALAARLDDWPDVYAHAGTLPVRLVVWTRGRRAAWTDGAEVLPMPQRTGRTLEPYRDGLVLRDVCTREDGAILACQVVLPRDLLAGHWPGLRMLEATGASDLSADLVRRIGLGPGEGAPFLLVGMDTAAERRQWRAVQARIYVGLVVAWLLALAGTLALRAGAAGALVGLWLGRALAAAVDLHRWLAATDAAPVYPAHPGSAASLVDPAYFATPFGGGWFASAADALATGALALATVWILRRRLVDRRRPGERPELLPRRAGPRGAVFGLAAALVLGLVNLVAGIVVENANARLIGHGVTVEFVTFWALHLALALLAFAPVILLTVLLPGGEGGARRPGRAHLADGLGVALVTAAATAALGLSWAMAGTAGVLAALVWYVIPALEFAEGLPRRVVWPALLLLAAVWNYASLRAVYDRVELGWLESKGELVSAADPDWSRYLLGEVLVAMQDADAAAPPAGAAAGLWRHEAAWRLWDASALADLGLPCLVELLDADYGSESLHAVGFMGDFQYELASRSSWSTPGKDGLLAGDDIVFQTERRLYIGGEEEVLVGETARRGGGTIRAEIPLRSWRLSTLLDQLAGRPRPGTGGYRPRSEIDRAVLLLHADDTGWLAAGAAAFPGLDADRPVAELRSGRRPRMDVPVGGDRWRCVWIPLPPGAARTTGEGFLLGLRRAGAGENLLDLSRLLLLNLVFWLAGMAVLQTVRRIRLRFVGPDAPAPWRPGFQERFLGGYLFIGLVLLLLVGGSVDRESRQRIQAEARQQTRAGLEQVVDQLRSLLVEQARSLAGSEYIADLLEGQFAGRRTVGPMHLQQAMVFAADGTLLLDETLSDLTPAAAARLLGAARRAPLVLMEDGEELYLGTVIPVDLGDVLAASADPRATTGFFFYRQRLDPGIVAGLAALVRGELDLRVEGRMALTSAADAVFSGRVPRLAAPDVMTDLLDHPAGATVLADPRRPFAFAGYQPVPVFGAENAGRLERRALPGILAVTFPDRERVHNDQRRQTALFLAGLANLILLTALLLAVLLSWNVFRPLRVLLAAVRSLGRGDYDAPLPEAGHDEVGHLAGAFGRMRDDLATAQERVAARERFLTTVLDRVTVGVLVMDAADGVVALNPAGRDILRVFRPAADEDAAARALLDDFHDLAGRTGRRGGELAGPGGRRTLRGALAPLDLPDGRSHTMLVFEDVSEFLENQKLALNAELARQVAHEIKNPLTPIQLSAQLVRQASRDRHPDLAAIVDDAVVRILDQVELLRRIAGEFSLLGRPDDLVAAPVDLEELAAETVAAYAGATPDEHAGPRFTVAPGPVPPVLGDADSVRKVLGNLAQNSLDAAAPGRPAVIGVDWRVEPDTVSLVWRDEGVGIPDDVAGRLFDPYFSTKSKGTGLGLAICRNLVDRMGGRIALANRTDGPGAEAVLTLRRADDEDSEETA